MENIWQEVACSQVGFAELEGLDKRVREGLRRQGYLNARPVQALCIPHALEGADILLKAPTGTGKTLAYVIPLLQALLTRLSASDGVVSAEYLPTEVTNARINWRHRYEAIVLAPSRELVFQLLGVIQSVTHPFNDLIRAVSLTECPSAIKELSDRLALSNLLVVNPGTLVKLGKLVAQSLPGQPGLTYTHVFPNVRHLVLDEADLILSVYGYENEVSAIFSPEKAALSWNRKYEYVALCKTDHQSSSKTQVMLLSATINQDLHTLRDMALYKPRVLSVIYPDEELEDPATLLPADDPGAAGQFRFVRLTAEVSKQVDHRVIGVARNKLEEYVALYGIVHDNFMSMRETAPKTLVFVNSANTAARCELILAQLNVKVARAIGTQSLATRNANITKFNSGQVKVLIAMDSQLLNEATDDAADVEVASDTAQKKKKRRKDKASLLSRGLDYKNVARVILLEPPNNLEDYIHKVGRCGRDLNLALVPTALTCVSVSEAASPTWKEVEERYAPQTPEEFTLDTFVKYRYRVEDVATKASKGAVRRLLDSDS